MTEVKQDEVVLTLDPFKEEVKQEVVAEAKEDNSKKKLLDEDVLTEAEKKMVNEFTKQINIEDTNVILQYGASAQQKMADFSEAALQNVKTKDLDEISGMLTDLIVELKGFDTDDKEKGLFALFKKQGNKIKALKAKYDDVNDNITKIVNQLEAHEITLYKDIATLDEMYNRNLVNFKELTMYIIAGEKKLQEARETTLQQLIDHAQETGLAEDSQKANDYAELCTRFEKKLYDLKLTREISIQMGPQIRLVQGSDTLMVEKIQSTIQNTIPLWKNQMVIALGLNHSMEAMKVQKEVSNMTNELLKSNADKLRVATTETAKESERGIVDIETLQHTNSQLIGTLDDVMKIQREGREKRQAAEAELLKIENELKQKLLEISR
ncbi:MAG: toxic anion resistance protein [Erysipelotrichaceae bacterium]|nr:toxic anion resistance protein [Erysipelotrichaceae bacterium]